MIRSGGVSGTEGASGAGGKEPATATDAEAVAVPPAPLAVMVYEMETVGLTVAAPDGPPTDPIPLSSHQDVASEEFQDNTEDWPLEMELGEEDKEIDGGVEAGAIFVTVTDVLAVAVPPAPLAVMVYVRLPEGVTVIVPDDPVTVPTPLLIERLLALVDAQLNTVELPVTTELGEADKDTVGEAGGIAFTVIATDLCVVPPAPVAVKV
ncbi:MAG: hypothetical protein V1707_01445 [bacterium]